jgi:hypothetical protein
MNLQMNSDCVDFNLHCNGGKYFTTDRNCQLFLVLRCYWKINGQEQIHEPTTYSDNPKLIGLIVLFTPKVFHHHRAIKRKTYSLFGLRVMLLLYLISFRKMLHFNEFLSQTEGIRCHDQSTTGSAVEIAKNHLLLRHSHMSLAQGGYILICL